MALTFSSIPSSFSLTLEQSGAGSGSLMVLVLVRGTLRLALYLSWLDQIATEREFELLSISSSWPVTFRERS